MLGLLAMHVAGLDVLAVTRGWTLLVAGIVAAPIAVAALVLLALTISIVALRTAQPFGLTMVCKVTELASVALLKFLAHLALCVGSYFLKLVALVAAIVKSSVLDCLQVLRKSL